MTLLSDYQNRFSSIARINASNPQNSGATTVDSSRETNAANDAAADFKALCGVAYDSTIDTHVAAGVPLVYARLLLYTGQADMAYLDKAKDECRSTYALVLGRNRIAPSTDSGLLVTQDTQGTRPFSDGPNFDRLRGNSPLGGGSTSDPSRPRLD